MPIKDEGTAMETSQDYHVRRAREELDLAYRSDRRAVSSAHLQLSALHMARLRTLGVGMAMAQTTAS